MLPRKVHQFIFFWITIVLVVTLPDSIFLLSISMFVLSGNWLFEGRFVEKIARFKQRKSLWIVISFYLIHVIWMLNTQNLSAGFVDLRLKLPFFLLPLIYGTSETFSVKQFKIILLFFIASVFTNSLIITGNLFGKELNDLREASPYISHIRFSLMTVLSVYILFYLLLFKKFPIRRIEKYIYPIIIIWLISFMFLFQTLTGIVIFLILSPVAIIWWSKTLHSKKWLYAAISFTILIILGIAAYIFYAIHDFNKKNYIDLNHLDKTTINGNPYENLLQNDEYENGNRIWIYVSHDELKKAWNEKSNISYYDGRDEKGQYIRFTLVRYMSSLGLRKDSLGFTHLSQEDIDLIEKGYSNYLYKNKYSFRTRLYQLFWELKHYYKTGDPSGQSVGQRLEYLKTGSHISRRFFWWGTGTGDLMQEFKKQYAIDTSKLPEKYQHRTHNQYLSFLITFGIFGALWILFALISPVYMEKRHRNFLVIISFSISLLSMVNEDTLETHIGVTFVAFFYAFFLYAMPQNLINSDEKA